MATKKKASSRSEVSAAQESALIEEQTKAFLSAGGKIENIEKGKSGLEYNKGQKNIVLNQEKAAKKS